MRLLLCSYYYPPSVGGLERQSHLLARGLSRRGHEVRVVSARLDGMLEYETLDGVAIHRVPTGSGNRWRKMATYLAGLTAQVGRHSRWADVIQVQQALYPAAAVAALAKLARRPLVVRNSGSGRFGAVNVMTGLPAGRLALWLIGQGATVVSLGEEMAGELRGAGIRRIKEIHNGVEIPEAVGPQERAEAKARFGLDGPVALYAGRFDEEKGVELLLDVWQTGRLANAQLCLVGAGPMQAALEQRARALGAQAKFFPPATDLRPYFAAADVFLLPSYSEGISNALLEAMAHGVAPLASDVGGNRTVISNPEIGVLAAREPQAFSNALGALLGDLTATRAMGERARQHVARAFSVDAMLDAYEALYRELSGR